MYIQKSQKDVVKRDMQTRRNRLRSAEVTGREEPVDTGQ